jgi:DNA-binding response OmpR family regulator
LLLVDDSDSNRAVLGSLLEEEGLEVDLAESFAQGRARVTAERPPYDVVLLDQHLGDGLGTQLVPVVRVAMPGTRILILSGSTGEERLAAEGVDAVLTKADDFSVILAAIRRVLPGEGAR